LQNSLDMKRTFWIVAAVSFINSLSFTAIIPVIYPYAQKFGLNDIQASLLLSVYALCQFLATPILGKLSDKQGRKKWLLISLTGTVLSNILAAFAGSSLILFAARMIDGLTGGNASIAQAIVVDTTNPKDRVKGFGIVGGAFGMGFVLGPALSFFVQSLPTFAGISKFGMSFLLSSFFAFLGFLVVTFFLPETLQNKDFEPITLKTLGLEKLFKALTIPKLGTVFLLNFLSGLTFTIFTFTFQPFFLRVLGQSDQTLALIFSMFGIVGIVSQLFLLKPITQKFKLSTILTLSFIIRGFIMIGMASFVSFWAFLPFSVLFAAINPFPQTIVSTLVSMYSKEKDQGINSGINSSYLSISNALGPLIGGLLAYFGYTQAILTTGFLFLLVAIYSYSVRAKLAT
jgi:predicted MFS family arabinose efflux permease